MRLWTRRNFLGALGMASIAGKGATFPTDWRRFADPSTEFQVFRLTDPGYSSYLGGDFGRVFSRRNTFLLFASDRTGSLQVFRMELKTGATRQLTSAAELDVDSTALLPDERSFCYFDGNRLCQMNLSSLREREIYGVPGGWRRGHRPAVTGDGQSVIVPELQGSGSRLRMVGVAKGQAATLVEAAWPMTDPAANPRRDQILYRQGEEGLWVVNFDGQQNRRLKTAAGRLGPASWAPDGKTVLYLSKPKGELHAIREHTPDLNQDRLVAKTSQFAHFGFNGNTSVFVGASQNRASPHILILLRATRRELTVCEHAASDAGWVAPAFSPDSQKIYFQSDRHGKRAIYSVDVERFVEKIETET